MTGFEMVFWPAMGLWTLWVAWVTAVQVYREFYADDPRRRTQAPRRTMTGRLRWLRIEHGHYRASGAEVVYDVRRTRSGAIWHLVIAHNGAEVARTPMRTKTIGTRVAQVYESASGPHGRDRLERAIRVARGESE